MIQKNALLRLLQVEPAIIAKECSCQPLLMLAHALPENKQAYKNVPGLNRPLI